MPPPKPPCRTCPFRLDQHAQDIPGFRLELAEGLVRTTSDQFGAPVFACHQSRPEKEVVCRGWLARHGWDSIAIRLRLMRQEMSPEELEVGDDWPELHETYEEVLAKLRADVTGSEPDPVPKED